jgi:hypothetical protein
MFTGTLNLNKVIGSIYNMIISQQVYGDPIAGGYDSLVDRARVDGSMYGDTKLFYSTDILSSYEFDPDDEEQLNVLKTHRPAAPKVQALTINHFRQIPLTLDSYLTKQGFTDQSTFSNFNGVLESWLNNTKRVEDMTSYNAYVGTATTISGKQYQTVALNGENDAQKIAEKVANILTELKDVSRSYNDNGFMRAYNPDDIIVVWNADFVNKIKKFDLPTIFHKEGLMDKFDEKNVLPGKYFGDIKPTTDPSTLTSPRAARTINVGNKVYYGGDLVTGTGPVPAGSLYTSAGDIICKIMHKNSVPFMSGFEVTTSFVNGRNLSTNMYLTYGRNTLEYLKEYPMITLKAVEA